MIITDATLEGLRTGLQTLFQQTFDATRSTTFYRDVATTVPSNTGSETYGWLRDFPELREWIGDRVVRDIAEDSYRIVNRKFESTIGVERDKIEDDSLGIYTPRAQFMAHQAAIHPDRLISSLLKSGTSSICYDGQNMFDTDHPVYPNHDGTGAAETVSNYATGTGPAWYLMDCSKPLRAVIFQERTSPQFDALDDPSTSDSVFTRDQYQYGVRYRCNAGFGFWQLAFRSELPLTEENFNAAYQAMMEIKRDGGEPMGVMPTHLIAPPALRADVNRVIKVMLGAGGASNPNYQAVAPVVTQWLA